MKYILDKPVKIGERIPTEGELTELFEVGRSTVREAVKGLVTRGVLEVRRGDGTYVISTIYMENDVLGFGNVEDRYRLALDLFDVRLMIEPEIVTWACRKATEEQIQDLFANYGTVHSVKLITDRETGRARGFGFVEMDDAEASAAIEALDNSSFGGRTLRVNEARPKDVRGPRG